MVVNLGPESIASQIILRFSASVRRGPAGLTSSRPLGSGTHRAIWSPCPQDRPRKEMPMLHNPPLLTIHRGHRRPEKALIEAFRGAQTSLLCDAMDGRGALDYRIKPLN